MAKVNLLRKCKVDGKWKLLPVARLGNRADAGYDLTRVLLRKVPVVMTAGSFYLEYRQPGSSAKVRRCIGDHPRQVKAALATQASVLGLRKRGVDAPDAPEIRLRAVPAGRSISDVVAAFKAEAPIEYRKKTFAKYRNALETFEGWAKGVGKTHVSQLGRPDVKAFLAAVVRDDGLDVSTAIDKAVIVVKVFRDAGAAIEMAKGDWPKVTEREPEVYEPEALQALFRAADQREYALFQTFLLSGMRDQEVAHLAWEDFDTKRSTLRVRKKLGFDPKTYQERTIPVPSLLVELLERWRKRLAETGETEFYVFPTTRHNRAKGAPGGQPDRHQLDKLKLLALGAGLNCGRCVSRWRGKPASCKTAPICGQFYLHKFRHTYATTLLHDGMDLKSLQLLLGHKDLKSTEKYLHALRPRDLLEKINRTGLATRFV